MSPDILAAMAAVITLVFIIDLLRRGILQEKYAVIWLLFAGSALLFAVVPPLRVWLSQLLGVAEPVNLVFFGTIVLLVLVAIQLSYELSRHEARIRRLAEESALLAEEVRSLRALNEGRGGQGDRG